MGDEVEISIADTGSGIPLEVRKRIFSAGFTTKPIGEGTGFGLALTREIVEDTHGGKIWFETELGRARHFSSEFLFSSQEHRSRRKWTTTEKGRGSR